ncbi:MAG: 30S ribosomal protein S16, partial [Saprospiraceae bacterium]|nr:30S ribosomal protein S16 [Saprospiraceae bacterium]
IELDRDRAFQWLMDGAQPTDTVRAILRFKGVLLRKHLARGVKKGAFTQEQADEQLAKWIEQKEARIAARREQTAENKRKHAVAVDGVAKVKAKPAPPVEEEAPAAEEVVEAAAEETAAAVETAAEEVAEAAAEVVEEAKETAEEVAEEVKETVEAAAEETAEAVAEVVEEAAPATEETAPAEEEEKSEDA